MHALGVCEWDAWKVLGAGRNHKRVLDDSYFWKIRILEIEKEERECLGDGRERINLACPKHI